MQTSASNFALTHLHVSNLFGRFNHHLEFEDGNAITIVTAPNGYGKTVLLRIIDSVFNSQLSFFSRIAFDRIDIGLGGKKSLIISKSYDDAGDTSTGVEFRTRGFGPKTSRHVFTRNISSVDLRHLDRRLPLDRVGPDQWFDYQSETTLSLEQVLDLYGEQLPASLRTSLATPKWLQEIVNSVKAHLVETQRLLNIEEMEEGRPRGRRRIATSSVVEKDAADLAERIGRLLQEYANEAQKLDQTFPERILKFQDGIVSDEEKIGTDLQSLTQKRDDLISVGLLGSTISEPIRPSEILQQENIRRILEIYVEDTSQKLGIFDETYEKIWLFKQLLEHRFDFKRIEIDPKHGIRVIDIGNDQPIPLSELSSGEQHELVLIYELLFSVEEGSIILIDEPELSLHVSWQIRFIEDLERILKLRRLKVLIATHSPQIIHDRWDLVQELGAKRRDG